MNDQELIDSFITDLVSSITSKYAKEIDFIILFGSAARGEFKKGISDIDLVIQLKTKNKRAEIEEYATKIFWELDKKYDTEFKKVLATVKPKTFGEKLLKNIEKSTHLYVPIFVFPPGWIDWEKGRLERPIWKPVAIILLHQTLIFEKFKYEGKMLYGPDIRKSINPKITFWERWKALQIPFYISLFSLSVSPFFINSSVKYSTKALLYQLDSVLDFAGQKASQRHEKIEKIKKETTTKIESELMGFYFKSTFSFLSDKQNEFLTKQFP